MNCYAFGEEEDIAAEDLEPTPVFPNASLAHSLSATASASASATLPLRPRNDQKKAKASEKKSKGGPPKPARPLSAYNFFFKEERQRLLDTLPVRAAGKPRRSHGKIGFQQMAILIGGRWKALDERSKAYYEDLAQQDRERYSAEKKMYAQQRHSHGGPQANVAVQLPMSSVQPSMWSQPSPVAPISSFARMIYPSELLEPLPYQHPEMLDESTTDLIIKMFR